MRVAISRRQALGLATLVGLACTALSAHAVPVIGYADGSFGSLSSCAVGYDCRVVSTASGPATQVQWGSQSLGGFASPSTLTATDVSFNTVAPVTGLEIGRLDWYNSATLRLNSSLDVFAVNYALAVHFDSPTGSDPNGNELFHFTIQNPVNPTGDSIYGLYLSDLSGLSSSITLDGVTLSNFRYSVADGSGAGTSWLQGNRWYNDESNYSRLSILADMALARPVPEPASYVTLMTGLLALGFTARRSRRLLIARRLATVLAAMRSPWRLTRRA